MGHDPPATQLECEDPQVIWFVSDCRRNGICPESCVRLAEKWWRPRACAFVQCARRASHALKLELAHV